MKAACSEQLHFTGRRARRKSLTTMQNLGTRHPRRFRTEFLARHAHFELPLGEPFADDTMLAERPRFVYSSGACEIDVARRELRILGSVVPIGGRAFQFLEILVQSAGELVTKDELMTAIWSGAIVLENTLAVHAMAARKALGPHRQLLKTESGRGYRLLGEWAAIRRDRRRPTFDRAPARSAFGPLRSNLPRPTSELIGRSAVVRHVRDAITAYRLVTLTGPGGIGKTRVALEAAREQLPEFSDAIWFVELASLSDPGLIPATIAGTIGLSLRGSDLPVQALGRAIGDRKLFLLLDNCEHLVEEAAATIETLLRSCPFVSILATSREIIRVEGEYVYRVPPLGVPVQQPSKSEHEQQQIRESSSVQLFMARLNAQQAQYSYEENALTAIAEICRHLDGIPLAIEFAAAHAGTFGVDQVLSHLGDRFALLTSGRRTALPKHRTLRATLDWSYELLTDTERLILRRLSIFAGSFTFEAAVAVAGQGLNESEIAGLVAALVRKSLIVRDPAEAAAELRLLETTRVYAAQKLAESGALNEIARRHAEYLLELLNKFDEAWKTTATSKYLVEFHRRAEDVRAALRWAFSPSGDVEIATTLTIASIPLWFGLSQIAQVRIWSEQALSSSGLEPRREMQIQMALGYAFWYLSPYIESVEPAFVRALEIAEQLGETSAQRQALWGLWAAHRGRGEHRVALDLASRFRAAAEDAGDLCDIHLGDRILALTHHLLGNQTIARQFAGDALRQPKNLNLGMRIGFQVETPIAMTTLMARILWLKGFPDQAMAAAQEAIDAAGRSGNLFSMCYAINTAGVPLALWVGALDDAQHRLDTLIEHMAGNPSVEKWVKCFADVLRLRQGSERDVLVASLIEPRLEASSLSTLTDLLSKANTPMPFISTESNDMLWNSAELQRVDAEILLWRGTSEAILTAEAKLLRSLDIAKAQSALSWELRSALSLARLWRRKGQLAHARDLLSATYDKFTEGFGTVDLVNAKEWIAILET
jgi:predicted ATPase/DNA-binding winged helix-turn-helix (wHTH) protein